MSYGSSGNKLFIGGLDDHWTEEKLRDTFEQYGEVSDVFMKFDRETGRPGGFGFVTYEDPTNAEDAIRSMDGKEYGSRTLKVEVARGRGRGGGGRGGFRDGGGYRGSRGGGDRYGGGERSYGGGGGGGGYRDRGDSGGGGYRSKPYGESRYDGGGGGGGGYDRGYSGGGGGGGGRY